MAAPVQRFRVGYQLLSWGRTYPRGWWAGARAAAAAGFAGIEGQETIASRYAGREEEFAARMERLGTRLTALYSTTDLDRAGEWRENRARNLRAARFARSMGARVLVIGGGERSERGTRPWSEYARQAGGLGQEMLETTGVRLALHPHLGSLVARRGDVERVMEDTDPRHVFLCADTAHLAAGGMDPAAILHVYRNRVTHVHLKDLRPGLADAPGVFAEIGQGALDWPAIVRALEAIGYDGWSNVELDETTGPAGAARRNHACLTRKLGVRVMAPQPRTEWSVACRRPTGGRHGTTGKAVPGRGRRAFLGIAAGSVHRGGLAAEAAAGAWMGRGNDRQ